MAADSDPALQIVLPMAEMLGWLCKGTDELIRKVGLQLIELLNHYRLKAVRMQDD